MAVVKVPVKAFLLYVDDQGLHSFVHAVSPASITLDSSGIPQSINTENGALALVCKDLTFARDTAGVFEAITKGAPR